VIPMTVSGRTQLSWNEFQQQHKGRGWSKQEMSEQWKAYKTSYATKNNQIGASIMHNWLQLGQHKRRQHQSNTKDTASLQDAAADLHTPVKQQSQQCQQQLQTSSRPSPAGSIGTVSISPITPSSCSSSQQQALGSCSNTSPVIPAQELSALRTAVEHLLSGQKGLEQHLQSVLLQDNSCREEMQCPGAARTAHSEALHACDSKQQQKQHQPIGVAAVGCFGFASSGLSWNSFQKACKGLGLSKAELSTAWKHYKATAQLPGQLLQQQQQQQLEAEPATDWLPTVHQHSQQQQQHQLLGKPAGSVKWATLKDWVQRTSRASSRAVSRVVSRVVSPAATPQPSPGAKARPTRHQQQQHQQQQHEVGNESHAAAAAAVAADSSCSIGGFVTSTAAVAGASVPAGQWWELDKKQYEAQQQAVLEQQLQEAEEELLQQQQQRRHHSQQQGRWQWPNTETKPAVLAGSSSSRPPARSSNVMSPGKYAGAASQQHCSRTARELVVHSCCGLLDDFGPWMPVSLQPGRLKRLKTAIPAKPGLYEWGVRMPVGTTAADRAAAAASGLAAVNADGSCKIAGSGVRTRSGAGGLQQGQPTAEYGPVVCFYLGKAGELQVQQHVPSCLGL
jgi:hypothetical protein